MSDPDVRSPSPASAPPAPDEADVPRLEPIEAPSSWKAKLAYLMARWQQGTVITPLKVLWARMPEGLRLAYELTALENRVTLDPDLHLLVKELVATINGCTFCQDIGVANAPTDELPTEKLTALRDYATHPAFADAERAALAYVEEATRQVDVADDTFEALRPHFSEREIVELTWLMALENYYNHMTRALNIGPDNLCDHDLSPLSTDE
jgi:alkylhydroperoxidase family enzyme